MAKAIRCANLDVRLSVGRGIRKRIVAEKSGGLLIGFNRHLYRKGECVRCAKEQPVKKLAARASEKGE